MALNNPIQIHAKLGEHDITFETGRLAKQAGGAVLVSCGDNVVLVTVVAQGHRADAPFFPLVVDYQEKQYAGGKIPGGFLKREGRLSDHEVLTSRLIDRPIRPLFPDGFRGDTQVTATVLSHDGELGTDMLAMCGASAALMISPSPFATPIAGVRVARVNGSYIANPTTSEAALADIDIVMACSREAIVMVEGECDEVSEADLLDSFDYGFKAVQGILDAQEELVRLAGKEKLVYEPRKLNPKVVKRVRKLAEADLMVALFLKEKHERYAAIDAVKAKVGVAIAEEFPEFIADVKAAFDEFKSDIARERTINEKSRIDGRRLDQVRAIETEIGILPRAHGSGLFTRGETQALATVTLGTDRDGKMVDGLMGKHDEKFMLHYNFPPFSTGEIKMLRGPGRREVGHGHLAQRSLAKVLPTYEQFPYVIRIVSEVLESNGSSSMATVCGGSMAMMDAGVPIRSAVAGIAMGLIMNEKGKFAILSDILGDEDALGDMDFKVCGTRKGITGLQMDIKIKGLSREVMSSALMQARQGRLHILDCMEESITAPRGEMSDYAPRITTITIPTDRIRDVIGSGGKTIRTIQERTGCTINIDDTGTVKVASTDRARATEAIEIVRALTASPTIGEIYLGTVAKVTDFGAFVTVMPGTDGLCHISELSEERVERVEDIVREGDEIIVKCTGIESGGKIRLSRKEALGQTPTVSTFKF
jgi:polyribonucleotide nucleotidyltransferase